MNTAVTDYKNKDIKSTLKLLLVLLPVFGLLVGVGLGLILGVTKFETSADLYLTAASVLLPAVALLTLALWRYFNQIDGL